MDRPRSALATALAWSIAIMPLGLTGCGDDPSKDAGTLDITAAKAQAAKDGQAMEGEAAPKKGARSATTGRSGGAGGAAAP